MSLQLAATYSSVNRVLSIPELLDLIFGFLDPQSNTNNAYVSKQWSEIALDYVWCQVPWLARVFRLLAPLKWANGGYV